MITWLIRRSNATFWRFIATVCVLILGGLAWYGLHRDIQRSENPCNSSATGVECVRYVCNLGYILGVKPSLSCRLIGYDGVPPRR